MVPTSETLSSILGPSSERYFGSRYAHVVPSVTALGDWELTDRTWLSAGTASVRLSGLWSKKGTSTVVPHVSTIDVISIALQASEHGLLRFAADVSWELSSLSVTAPRAPVEEGLDRIRFTISSSESGTEVTTVTTVTRISGFTVTACMAAVAEPVVRASAEHRVYSDVFRSRVPEIGAVEPSADGVRTTAQVPRQTMTEVGGVLDAHRRDGLNAIDAFVVALQLGQVLLYELDGLNRAVSDTLWMRTTRIVSYGARSHASDVSTSLEDSRLRNLRGEEWRLATIRSTFPGLFDISCAVAHRLPS